MHSAFLIFAQELIQFFIRLFWRFGFHDSHTVHHAMDMCIDPDKGHIVEMREDDFCRLYSDSWECADSFERVWDFSSMLVDELFCCLKKVLRFDPIIVYASEYHFDFFWFELQEVSWSFYDFKKFLRCFINAFIRHLR